MTKQPPSSLLKDGPMILTAAEIADRLHGQLYGCPGAEVHDVASLNSAQPGTVTFLSDMREASKLNQLQATIVLLPDTADGTKLQAHAEALITVRDPFACFMELMADFRGQVAIAAVGTAATAVIDPTSEIGSEVSIGDFVKVGPGCKIGDRCQLHPGVHLGANVVLGDDVVLYPNVVIYSGCVLKSRVMIHANSVIGADGFGYRLEQGQFKKLPHYGRVILQEDVEIGASTTIDRGMIDDTVIGQGTKIDNQVMIGHNCQIGKHNVIVSQVGLAGSVSTGDYCRFGGQVGIADHVKIGNNASLVAQAGVFRDIPENSTMGGSPATPMEDQKKVMLAVLKLPELRQTVRRLQKQIEALEKLSQQPATTSPELPRIQNEAA